MCSKFTPHGTKKRASTISRDRRTGLQLDHGGRASHSNNDHDTHIRERDAESLQTHVSPNARKPYNNATDMESVAVQCSEKQQKSCVRYISIVHQVGTGCICFRNPHLCDLDSVTAMQFRSLRFAKTLLLGNLCSVRPPQKPAKSATYNLQSRVATDIMSKILRISQGRICAPRRSLTSS